MLKHLEILKQISRYVGRKLIETDPIASPPLRIILDILLKIKYKVTVVSQCHYLFFKILLIFVINMNMISTLHHCQHYMYSWVYIERRYIQLGIQYIQKIINDIHTFITPNMSLIFKYIRD